MSTFTQNLRKFGDNLDKDTKAMSGIVGLGEAIPNFRHRKAQYENKLDQYRESQRNLQAISALQNIGMSKGFRDNMSRMDAASIKNLGERGELLRTIGANKALLYS